MSERMTAINLPGTWGAGIADHGRKTVPEMLVLVREYAESMRVTADAILSATDADFRVESYVGPYARRNLEILQQGKKP